MLDLGTQVREYLDATAAPVEMEDILAKPVSESPVRPLLPRRPGRGLPGWAYAAAAAAMVLLVGATAWLARSEPPVGPSEPSTVTSTPPTVTTVPQEDGPSDDAAPAEIVAESVTSSVIGDIRWTVISGGPTSIPDVVVTTPDGFAGIDVESGGLSVSNDGVAWRPVPTPGGGFATRIDGTRAGFELTTIAGGSTTTWESDDFVTWKPAPGPPAGVVPIVAGPGVRTQTGESTVHRGDGKTFAAWRSWVSIDWREIAGLMNVELRDFHAIEFEGPQARVLKLIAWPSEEVVARLSLSISGTSDEWVIDIADAESGQPISSITGSSPDVPIDHILQRVAGGVWTETNYFVTDSETIERVHPDWVQANRDQQQALLLGLNNSFLAYIRVGNFGEPGTTQIWRSVDGRAWTQEGTAPWPGTQEIMTIAERNRVAVVSTWDGDQSYSVLWSEDGISWTPASRPPLVTGENPNGEVFAIGNGFLWISRPFDEDFAVWASRDGDVWEAVDTSDPPIPSFSSFEPSDDGSPGISGGASASQTLTANSFSIVLEITVENEPPVKTVWIAEVEG